MKKKFLLGIVPALLALSACNGAFQPKEEDNNLFLEDTLAHDEIFGSGEALVRSLQPRRVANANDPVDHPDTDVHIGYQSLSEKTGYKSFRFVAAVRFETGQLDPTEAVWTRTVSYANGTARMAKDNKPCAKAYLSLSAGSGSYSIDTFNSDHELYDTEACTHFVVYTLRNVPVDPDYYISAYLTLSGGKSLGSDSKAVAVNASETQKFVYYPKVELNAAAGICFLDGSIKGQSKTVNPSAIRYGSNLAQFEYVDFNANDTFVIKEFYDTELIVHGYSETLKNYSTRANTYFKEGDNDTIKVNTTGNYALYLNYSKQLFIGADDPFELDQPTGIYVRGDAAGGWDSGYESYEFVTARDNKGILLNVHLKTGEFKIGGASWSTYNLGSDRLMGGAYTSGNIAQTNGGKSGSNIKVVKSGYYNLYLTNNDFISIETVRLDA